MPSGDPELCPQHRSCQPLPAWCGRGQHRRSEWRPASAPDHAGEGNGLGRWPVVCQFAHPCMQAFEPGLGRSAIVRKERLGALWRRTSLLSARLAPACAAAARAETARGVEVQAGEGAPCGTRHVGRAGPVLEASGLRLRRLRAGNRKIRSNARRISTA